MNARSARNLLALLALFTSAGVAPLAVAQQAAAPEAKNDDTVTLDKVVVTGSYIPAALDEAKAMPVQVIDRMSIDLSGVNTNVLDVLRKTVPQIQGGNNIGVENANISGGSTNGGSQAALRNTDTLVLINGKRVGNAAVAANGGYQFVDLNMIPLSAVDRIEVLTDGASAIYGSDAVSGVINIVMRTDYRGAEANFHYTAAPNDTGGYWRQKAVSVVVGAGDAKTNVMVSAEWNQADPLWQRDTAYDNPYYGTASYPGVMNVGGTYYKLKAGLNAPPTNSGMTLAQLVANGTYVVTDVNDVVAGFNLALRPTVMSANDKRIFSMNASHLLSDTVTAKADFIYAHTMSEYQLNPQPVTASSTTLIANGNTTVNTNGITVRNRFLGGPNRIYNNTTDFYRATAGLEGKVNDYFNWEVGVNYNLSKQVALGENLILNSALLTGIYSGKIDLYAITQDPAKMAAANIYGTSVALYDSELYTYDAMAHGMIIELPAGALQYAAGAQYRKETLTADADYNSIIPPGGTTSLWNSGTSLAKFSGSRTVDAYFGELNIPVFSPKQNIPGLHLVTIDGAVRHEAYSDGNSTTVPKISLRYLPINDELALRGTYSKSFTEPQMYSLYGPSSSGFTTGLGGLDAYNTSGQPTGAKFPPLQGFQLGGSNPALTPSHSEAYTAGFVYSPKFAKGLEITVDYFNIKQTDLVGSVAGTTTIIQDVEKLGPASPFAPYVALGNYPGMGGTLVTTPGQLSPNVNNLYVLQSLVNIGSQEQDGWDVSVKYTLPWNEYGRFTIDSRWSFLNSFVIKSGPTDTEGTEYAGNDLYGVLAKQRGYTTVDWAYKSYGASLAWQYIASVDDSTDGSGETLPAYNTVDLQLRYDLGALTKYFKGVNFSIGCNNIFDEQPPLDRTNYASPPFDASAYSFFGRMYYADLKIKF